MLVKPVVVALALAAGMMIAPGAKAEQFINILTGGTSGVYYPIGVALSKIYTDNIPGVRTAVQSTGASVENLNLLQAGRGELALTLGDSLAAAWAGDEEAGFPRKLDKLRGLSAIYSNYVQIVASKESGVTELSQLRGKRISVGAPRSGTELNARTIFAAVGLQYEDFSRTEFLPFGQSVDLIKNRQLDVTLQSAGLGVASIRDLASSQPISIVPIPPDVVEAIDNPAFLPGTIPAGTYDGQTDDVPTVAIINYLVTSTDVDEDMVYMMTKHLYESLDQLRSAHAAAAGITLDNALQGMPLPLHPGAERYYREVGLLP